MRRMPLHKAINQWVGQRSDIITKDSYRFRIIFYADASLLYIESRLQISLHVIVPAKLSRMVHTI